MIVAGSTPDEDNSTVMAGEGDRPPLREFEPAEYAARWERARTGLAARGLDALFITSEANYRYLSGHVTPFWVSKAPALLPVAP